MVPYFACNEGFIYWLLNSYVCVFFLFFVLFCFVFIFLPFPPSVVCLQLFLVLVFLSTSRLFAVF